MFLLVYNHLKLGTVVFLLPRGRLLYLHREWHVSTVAQSRQTEHWSSEATVDEAEMRRFLILHTGSWRNQMHKSQQRPKEYPPEKLHVC